MFRISNVKPPSINKSNNNSNNVGNKPAASSETPTSKSPLVLSKSLSSVSNSNETNNSHEEIDNANNLINEELTNSLYAARANQNTGDDKLEEVESTAVPVAQEDYEDEDEYDDEEEEEDDLNEVNSTNNNSNSREDLVEDEEDETSFLSPMVLVKYGCEYDYDDKTFKLIEGEKLFLINKANQDWWLCLRLDENLTFFVPASYVKEIANKPKIKKIIPPPRPPPPPPYALDKLNNKQNNKPEVKKRQLLNYSSTNQHKLDPVIPEQQEIYENLSNLNTGIAPVSTAINEELNTPDSIIEDLDNRLNREDNSPIIASNNNNNKIGERLATSFRVKQQPSSNPIRASVSNPISVTPEPDYNHVNLFELYYKIN